MFTVFLMPESIVFAVSLAVVAGLFINALLAEI